MTMTDVFPAIRVRALEKSYEALHVLRGVDFDVTPGSVIVICVPLPVVLLVSAYTVYLQDGV